MKQKNEIILNHKNIGKGVYGQYGPIRGEREWRVSEKDRNGHYSVDQRGFDWKKYIECLTDVAQSF